MEDIHFTLVYVTYFLNKINVMKSKDLDEIEEVLSRKSAYHLAAIIIANNKFPLGVKLPRFFPTPFNNFGHYYLCDYEMLLKILWHTIRKIKSRVVKWHLRIPLVLALLCSFPFLAYLNLENLWALAGFVFVPLIVYLIARIIVNEYYLRAFSEIRAEVIENLLSDDWEVENDEEIPSLLTDVLKEIGDGRLSKDEVPVIIMYDSDHPFQGYGRLQVSKSFTCRPADDRKVDQNPDIEVLNDLISNINEYLSQYEVSNYNTGFVVLVNGKSISINSDWLNENKVPHLKVKQDEINSIDKNKSLKSSFRTFYTIQIVFPQYMTSISFFIRFYMAENSLSCNLFLTTLGPPLKGKGYLLKKLSKAMVEREKSLFDDIKHSFEKKVLRRTNTKKYFSKPLSELMIQRGFARSSFKSQVKLSKIVDFDPLNEEEHSKDEYKDEYKKAIANLPNWLGYHYYPLNWREMNSQTFPEDFFDNLEAKSTIITLFEQITRKTLYLMKDYGFDISKYLDEDGKINIKSDQIENLVVGEKIQYSYSQKTTKEN